MDAFLYDVGNEDALQGLCVVFGTLFGTVEQPASTSDSSSCMDGSEGIAVAFFATGRLVFA